MQTFFNVLLKLFFLIFLTFSSSKFINVFYFDVLFEYYLFIYFFDFMFEYIFQHIVCLYLLKNFTAIVIIIRNLIHF